MLSTHLADPSIVVNPSGGASPLYSPEHCSSESFTDMLQDGSVSYEKVKVAEPSDPAANDEGLPVPLASKETLESSATSW